MENGARTFKISAKRTHTNFPFGVYDINRLVGAAVLREFPQDLSVDVHNPDFVIGIEVKEKEAYVYSKKIPGPGGLPVGASGKAILLLSGGLDSPVAGWYAMKRGVVIVPLSFISPPYTGKESKEKIMNIVEILKEYSGGRKIHLYLCPLTPVLELLKDTAPQKFLLVLQRRSMMRIAERLAEKTGSSAIYTGESVGQVASQTLQNLGVIEEATKFPVIRPLSGFDKVEIVKKAKEIGTYEVSIKPHLDVCSMFTPKRPATKAPIDKVLEIEEELGESLFRAEEEAFASIEKVVI
jgi:thiamine biosynthesis protein ThiI